MSGQKMSRVLRWKTEFDTGFEPYTLRRRDFDPQEGVYGGWTSWYFTGPDKRVFEIQLSTRDIDWMAKQIREDE